MSAASSVSQPITTFSPDAMKFVHPGISTLVKNEDQANRIADRFTDANKLWNAIFTSTAHPNRDMPISIIPALTDYFQHAVALQKTEALLAKGLQLDTAKKLVKVMKDLHLILLPRNPNTPNVLPGVFRKKKDNCLVIVRKSPEYEKHHGEFVEFIKTQKPALFTSKFIEDSSKADKLRSKGRSFEEIEKELPEYAKLFREHNIVFPDASKIDDLLQQLFVEFAATLTKGDAISAACVLHQGITRIHPFARGNGRMGRLMMNIVLMQNGHQSVGFDDDAKYTKAIRIDEQAPKLNFFYNFVKGLIDKQKGGSAAAQADVKQKDQTAAAPQASAAAADTAAAPAPQTAAAAAPAPTAPAPLNTAATAFSAAAPSPSAAPPTVEPKK